MLPILCGQYQDCWCPGDFRSQEVVSLMFHKLSKNSGRLKIFFGFSANVEAQNGLHHIISNSQYFYAISTLLRDFEIWASVRRTRRTLFSDALPKIFSRNLCIVEIVLLTRISSLNFVHVPKALQFFIMIVMVSDLWQYNDLTIPHGMWCLKRRAAILRPMTVSAK